MTENKVTYGLKNAHYSKITISEDGSINYSKPVPLPGSTELTLDARGDLTEFYADDMLYYSADNNQGYDGKLTLANMPESFAIDILGEEKDEDDGVVTEKADAKGSYFALMFEFDGDIKKIRHVHYYCKASRPSGGSTTKTDSVEPNTIELSFVSSPRPTDLKVRTKTTTTVPKSIYDNWYNKVYEKVTEPLTVTIAPKDEATSVPVTSSIVWTFNKAINESDVVASNFLIMNSTGVEVPGKLSIDDTKKIVTFKPNANLSATTIYIATVLKTIKGNDGSSLTTNSIINFTTA